MRRRSPGLHRVTLGRTREVRGPDALERGFAGIIIVAAMLIATTYGIRAMYIVQSVEAVSLASGPEIDAVVYHTVNGHWPGADTPGIAGHFAGGMHATNVTLGADGVVNMQLALGRVDFNRARAPRVAGAIRGALSFRPELLGAADAPTISFLCGYAKPVAGGVASGPNATTLSRQYLPPFCR